MCIKPDPQVMYIEVVVCEVGDTLIGIGIAGDRKQRVGLFHSRFLKDRSFCRVSFNAVKSGSAGALNIGMVAIDEDDFPLFGSKSIGECNAQRICSDDDDARDIGRGDSQNAGDYSGRSSLEKDGQYDCQEDEGFHLCSLWCISFLGQDEGGIGSCDSLFRIGVSLRRSGYFNRDGTVRECAVTELAHGIHPPAVHDTCRRPATRMVIATSQRSVLAHTHPLPSVQRATDLGWY